MYFLKFMDDYDKTIQNNLKKIENKFYITKLQQNCSNAGCFNKFLSKYVRMTAVSSFVDVK